MGDNPDDNEKKESPIGAGSKSRGDDVEYVWQGIHGTANRPPPPTVKQLRQCLLDCSSAR